MRVGVLALLTTLCVAPIAAAVLQTTERDPVTDVVRTLFPEHRKNIVAAFNAMPEDKYAFRPTPDLMTFGELAVHIASANIYYCRRLGGAAPSFERPKATASKKELMQLLDHAFDYCAPIVSAARDASLADPSQVASGTAPTRALTLIELISGMDHHYGQAAGYLRLNGVLPPTATAGKQE
jgi:uncharacterized damage-inducible protein DinB